jgi:hypothetical protein
VCLPDPPGIPCALAQMVTGVNRVTGIFERDIAVRLALIANEPSIIYTDPATDPYTDGDPAAMREENQANLDAVIGSAELRHRPRLRHGRRRHRRHRRRLHNPQKGRAATGGPIPSATPSTWIT